MSDAVVTRTDIERLEKKLDKVSNSIEAFIRMEERQNTHAERLGKLEVSLTAAFERITLMERNLDRWVTRGITVWVLAGLLFTVFKLYFLGH